MESRIRRTTTLAAPSSTNAAGEWGSSWRPWDRLSNIFTISATTGITTSCSSLFLSRRLANDTRLVWREHGARRRKMWEESAATSVISKPFSIPGMKTIEGCLRGADGSIPNTFRSPARTRICERRFPFALSPAASHPRYLLRKGVPRRRPSKRTSI